MEDIGNLIYYILIFVVAIISWISNSNKKKQQHQTTLPSAFPTQELSDLPPVAPGRSKQNPPPVPKRARRESFGNTFLSSTYNDNSSFMQEEDVPSIADELELNNSESFRKAIIYAEILNRKEW